VGNRLRVIRLFLGRLRFVSSFFPLFVPPSLLPPCTSFLLWRPSPPQTLIFPGTLTPSPRHLAFASSLPSLCFPCYTTQTFLPLLPSPPLFFSPPSLSSFLLFLIAFPLSFHLPFFPSYIPSWSPPLTSLPFPFISPLIYLLH
jgi:hypothetical protein